MSQTTMRRRVREHGGYYSRQRGVWILPGASHNCSPSSVDPLVCATLEEAAEQCEAHAARCAEVHRFGEAEAAYLRANR